MSATLMYISLETQQNVQNMRSDFSSSGSSNPQNENGSNLQGLDDPLEVSRVSFSDVIEEFSSSYASTITSIPQLDEEGRQSFIDFHVFDYYCYLDDDSDIYFDTVRATLVEDNVVYTIQSGVAVLPGTESGTDTQVLLTMNDATQAVSDEFITQRDDTYYQADIPETNLSQFFARPVRIGSYAWSVGTTFAPITISPFQAFWSDPRVVNRLAYNRYLKCDMCVRFLINGTPFHYGLLMASVGPSSTFDQFADLPVTRPMQLVYRSQRPHVYLDPSTSQGGCLKVPYFGFLNAYNVCSNDLATAFNIDLRSVSALAHTSGTVEPITITVLAWAENVVLSGPTLEKTFGLVPQSGDEYGSGILSRPAYILAKIAGRLTDVPYIAPYALATQIGASRLSYIAKVFGYSKPSVVTDIAYMNRRQLPNFASTTQHDPIYKATLDDKQEVTIDPRVVGLCGEDEMTIKSLVTRESYLTKFGWGQAGVPDTRLFQIKVTPCLFDNFGTAPTIAHYLTPMCWTSMAFRHWRGSIKYRFRAVASSFHRGRLRIVYDPGVVVGNTEYAAGNVHNMQFTYVWDLSESKEAIIEVGWNSNFPYLRTADPQVAFPFNSLAGVAGNLATDPLFDNGVIAVYVMNELAAPSTLNTGIIDIVVSVCAGDDFELCDPNDEIICKYKYAPQSGYDVQSGEMMQDTAYTPYMGVPHVKFGNSCDKVSASAIHFGDPVVSLRNILKRYVYSMTVGFPDTGDIDFDLNMNSFPLYPGKHPGAVHTALLANVPYNYCAMTPLNWFTPGFYARRGGLRNRFIPLSPRIRGTTISRSNNSGFSQLSTPRTAITTPTSVALAGMGPRALDAGFRGCNVGAPDDNPVDIEIPYHSFQRFFNGRASNLSTQFITNDQGIKLRYSTYGTVVSGTNTIAGFDRYVSAAEDFSLAIFVGCPVVWPFGSLG